MAQYKVPQDVEADDKLLGPFTFRQFIYLMITIGSIGLAFALANIFPLLAIIPVPFVLFFGVLALPIKKDQPMETYLTAVVSYHIKPKTRVWNPGQAESTIVITAPKQVEAPRARSISGEEASTRLSFLAGVVDTEGYSIHGDLNGPMRDDFLAENLDAHDMLDGYSSPVINQMIQQEQQTRRTNASMPQQLTPGTTQIRTAPMSDAQAFATPTLPASYQANTPKTTVPTGTFQVPSAPTPSATIQAADPLRSSTVIQPLTSGSSTPVNPLTAPKSTNSKPQTPTAKSNEVYVSLH